MRHPNTDPAKRWRKRNPDKWRRIQTNWHLRRLYGITVDAYEAILQTQAGVCAICKREPGRRKLAVDHNHVTGRIRGLLCSACNTGLGQFGDSRERLQAAMDYLALRE